MLAHPLFVLLLKVADGDDFGPTSNGKLVFLRRSLHDSCGKVDTQDDEEGLPCSVGELPEIGIAISTAGNKAVMHFWVPSPCQ